MRTMLWQTWCANYISGWLNQVIVGLEISVHIAYKCGRRVLPNYASYRRMRRNQVIRRVMMSSEVSLGLLQL